MDRNYLYDEWLAAQAIKANGKRKHSKPFIGERGYPHLDGKLFFPRTGNNVEQAAWLQVIVTQTEKLRTHGFLPFIRNDQRQRRFRQPPHDYIYSSVNGQRDQKLFPHIKSRPIMYASHRDACIFSFYSYCLEQLYEKELESRGLQDCVIAYRSIDGKNNVDFAKFAFDEMSKRADYDCIMVDVKGFFDNLNHALLHNRWDSILPGGFKSNDDHEVIFSRITTYHYLNGREAIGTLKAQHRKYLFRELDCFRLCKLKDYNQLLKKTVRTNKSSIGIPQGSPISGVLANLYLLDFDTAMKDIVVTKYGGVYQRYSDDIFILCPINKAKEVYTELQKFLGEKKLKLGLSKTEAFRKLADNKLLTNITSEIEPTGSSKRTEAQYLGFHFNGETISFRPSTLSKHVRGRKKPDYLQGSYRKTLSPKVARQVNKIMQVVKKK